MDDVPLVEVIDSFQDLLDGLRRIFLREFTILTNSIKKLATRRELGDYIEFILNL